MNEKKAILEGLEKVRKGLCGYTGSHCDCKYGAEFRGEQTGCPEIYAAMDVISGLTLKELRSILKKKGGYRDRSCWKS